ncbi:hypothetical protein [Streptomyces spectabilis]|uniref:Uncharacterized protein n=1 Tax=Streptomyces spectabilis TaxID=68270 RepID=A0A516R1Q6_STRST|nr:hypothetical protein [Streptomyces spectabilis]QDQ09594.1 hypothetical protein FH965_02655 [Streptomyces spectabilis]
MTEPRIADLAAALRDRTHPAVGVWNRLEGRPRTVGFDRALRAEVRDALWMLTRQWQLGEFRGTDAGSPVTATYAISTSTPSRFRPDGGPAEALPADRPLETVAERRPLPFTFGTEPIAYDLRLLLGRRWLKLLAASSVLRPHHFGEQYIERYPVALPDPTADADTARVAHPEDWATLQALAGRRMDGYLLYQHVRTGGHASDGIDGPGHRHRADLDALGTRLVDWFDHLIDQPTGATPQRPDGDATWNPRALEHSFSVSAADPSGGEKVLTAAEYPGGELDWYAFSVASGTTLGGTDPTPSPTPRTVFPAPVRFSGMPLPRWWALEDGRTNFAAVTPDSTDLARLIFLEFALVFSNGWYQLPCDVPAGTLASVRGLAVTDVFGQRRWITPAGKGDDQSWQRWSMFTLSALDAHVPPSAPADDGALLLPPGVPKVATGPALEEVWLVRDENANLVWGIEQTVRRAAGGGRGGDETAAETLAHRRRLHPPPAQDAPRAPIAYAIASPVPENWIPFIPVHVPGDSRTVQLRRAAMPSAVDATPVRPRTALLREGLDAGRGYFINEEEVPQSGTRVTVAFNRTRWRDGRVVVWLAAHRGLGRGERSSGLGFDALVDTPMVGGE